MAAPHAIAAGGATGDNDAGAVEPSPRAFADAPRRTTRRPSSASHARQPSVTSIVQQKLQAALQSADKSAADLLRSQPLQSSFRARGVANAAAAEREQADRSISRYRNDAAIVSFADLSAAATSSPSAMPFSYSSNFMPGVHFYTFLAMKEATAAAAAAATAAAAAAPAQDIGSLAHPPTALLGAPLGAGDADHPTAGKSKKSGALRMWIPDTIVYGETGRAVWLYTDDDGFVQRSTDVSDKVVLERLVPSSSSDLDAVVVCKEPTTTPAKKHAATSTESNALAYQGNLLRLLSPGELKTVLSNVSSSRSSKSFALQKFVRCNGSKAFLVRAVYEAGKPAYAWMINNTTPMVAPTPTVSQVLLSLGQDAAAPIPAVPATARRSSSVIAAPSTRAMSSCVVTETAPAEPPEKSTEDSSSSSPNATSVPLVTRMCTSVQIDKACTFIKLSERGCTTVAELNQRIVKYIEQRFHLQLQTLVADFVKDTDGRWWLLQVKHFRVKPPVNASKPYYSLPRRLRMQYLGYRDSSIVDESTESDEEHEHERRVAQLAAQLAQRQVCKLTQCKCCLAAYPKSELSFKMTLKMINEMLIRIRSRLPPEKTYTFLAAALVRESPDPSLAYESWSVCSFCYAIYERDQQLQKVEIKFADILGVPDLNVVHAGLGKFDDRSEAIDPASTSTVLPAQLTLCRLMLVINGIYDIPPELYDAENDPAEPAATPSRQMARLQPPHSVTSRLYLRISALGYTECIPVDVADIIITQEKAPRGTRRRRSSTASSVDGEDSDEECQSPSRRQTATGSTRPLGTRNYWLPINLIRAVHFFAPRTPLHAKLKETSGLTPFLNEDNSISIQFVRATEPPLQDPATHTISLVERGRTRRAALRPQHGAKRAGKSETPPVSRPPYATNHSVLLGATKIRMAQFRSAYVTKLDFYACMALTGEMFNIKGNIGLERVRYVDTKLLTSQYRLRAYNGVYIPDPSYSPCDPISAEWMDSLRAMASHNPSNLKGTRKDVSTNGFGVAASRQSITDLRGRTASVSSLGTRNEDMDEELEYMIEYASQENLEVVPPTLVSEPTANTSGSALPETHTPDIETSSASPTSKAIESKPPQPMTASAKQSLRPATRPQSQFESQMSMLMEKPVLSPRNKLPLANDPDRKSAAQPSQTRSPKPSHPSHKRSLWSFVIQLNHVHNLQSRERPYCRWECYYELFEQRRSAVERSGTAAMSPPHLQKNSDATPPNETTDESAPSTLAPLEVVFSCTHKFFLSTSLSMLSAYFRTHPVVRLHLRNDVYASTRSQSVGEFFCQLDVSDLVHSRRVDATLDIHATPTAPELTPREAAIVSRSPPYLSVAMQLSALAYDPEDVVTSGDFAVVGSTSDGIHVLKKIT